MAGSDCVSTTLVKQVASMHVKFHDMKPESLNDLYEMTFSIFQLSIHKILSTDSLPVAKQWLDDIRAYPWHIETKYYSADVSLCTTNSRTIGDKSFAKAVQAFIAVFDSSKKSSFEQVEMWLPYLKQLEPPVQMLVCNQCTDDDVVSRGTALSWCLDNSFELIELNPIIDEEDEEDDFKETVGIKRVIEALSCHSWPVMTMKEKPAFHLAYLDQLTNDLTDDISSSPDSVDKVDTGEILSGHTAACSSGDTAHSAVTTESRHTHSADSGPSLPLQALAEPNTSCEEIIDTLISQEMQQRTNCDPVDNGMDEETFERLFEQLRIMKDAAGGMSTEDRKKYAEKVTMQFWQAMGGNLDEFDGLSSDSDQDLTDY